MYVQRIIPCGIESATRTAAAGCPATAYLVTTPSGLKTYKQYYFQKALSPNLPEDLAISFYIQSHKLIFVAYQLSSVHGTMRIDSCQADCAVPWLSDVLFMLTAALHMCQQLKDKVN